MRGPREVLNSYVNMEQTCVDIYDFFLLRCKFCRRITAFIINSWKSSCLSGDCDWDSHGINFALFQVGKSTTDPTKLGPLGKDISKSYNDIAKDTKGAVKTVGNPEV